MLFDTHAHLNDPAFDEDRESLIAGLQEKGISMIMNVGCCGESSEDSVNLANKYDFIYAAVGSHPDSADEVNDAVLARYAQLCRENPKVRAIGEIGLDYHYETIPREIQKKAFIAQMELAERLNMPVIVHERDAHGDGLDIVRRFPRVTGVFHCYSGSAEMTRELVRRGWYIGFTGVLTFKNARRALEAAAVLPLDRIVLETDCPFMAPEPFRGRRNDPGYLYRMSEALGQVKGLSPEEIAAITAENGRRLFRIG